MRNGSRKVAPVTPALPTNQSSTTHGKLKMSTPQQVSTAATQAVSTTNSPNQYHLHSHGDGVQISYYPTGAGPLTKDGPIILAYQDAATPTLH
jgi:hypothetical protein